MSKIILGVIERFDWTSPDGQCTVSFDVSRMLHDIANGHLAYQPITAVLDHAFATTWLTQRDLNLDLCTRMSAKRRDEPVLGVWMPDSSVLLIDGSHRYYARYIHGCNTVDYNVIAEAYWKPYAWITKGKLQ